MMNLMNSLKKINSTDIAGVHNCKLQDLMTNEMNELKSFTNTLQADLDNLIFNLVTKGMVLATDSNGKLLELKKSKGKLLLYSRLL